MIPTPQASLFLASIDLGYASVHLRGDGLLQVDTAHDHVVTEQEARIITYSMGRVSGEVPRPVLKIAGRDSTEDEGTREFTASHEGQRYSLAEAVVINSTAQRLMGNFYLRINRPVKPMRLFTSVEEAVKWLKTFL